MTKYTKTKYALTINCKCGSCIAASMIYGGLDIDAEFTQSIADVTNEGGKVSLVNTETDPIQLAECTCKKQEEQEVELDPNQLNLF